MLRTFYTWTCPSCGHVNRFLHEEEITAVPTQIRVVTNCDLEEGGCDKPHAIFIHIEVRTESFALQIQR